MKRYLNDWGFWLAVSLVSLVTSPFEGVGRALAERWLG